MLAYRLTKKEFAEDLSGIGAKLYGGRWNFKGTAVIYTSGSISLAVLELLVHVQPNSIPDDIFITTIQIPDECKTTLLDKKKLPKRWKTFPPVPKTADFGSKWAKDNKSLILKVPSAIVDEEYNYLINPSNPEISRVKIIKTEKFEFDSRIVKLIENTY